MAASLVNSLKGLCIQSRNTVRLLSHSEKSVNNASVQGSMRQSPVLQAQPVHYNLQSLTQRGFHTSPACCTTPEMKEWREHRVVDRFYRLPWGAWIRTRGGRRKGLYKKTPRQRWQLQQHIFCNYRQNRLLDKLVTPKWREPKYFVDSPYEPYHQRTNSYWHPNHRKFYP